MNNIADCLRCGQVLSMLCESMDENANPKAFKLVEFDTDERLLVNVAFCSKCGYTELKMQML